MKNNSINNSRLLLLCRKGIIENWKKILLTVVGVVGVLAIVMILRAYSILTDLPNQSKKVLDLQGFTYPTFFLFLFAVGMISASLTFVDLSNKQGRFAFLTVPASSGEKFLSRWLISTLFFFIMYPIGYLIALSICSLFLTVFYPDVQHILISTGGITKYLSGENSYTLFILASSYFVFQSIYTVGSTVWPKMSFIKTTASIIGIITCVLYILKVIGMRIYL